MNIFVSGLSYSLSSEELSSLFSQFGTVESAKVVTDRDTGRSRGFGFVEMPVEEEARQAISQLDQSDQKGRKISVKEAEDRPKKSFGANRPSGGGGGGFNRGYSRGGDRY